MKARRDLRCLEFPLVRARTTPTASELVAVQVSQNVASLADSPALDELSDSLSPEGREVTLKLIVPGHDTKGRARSRSVYVGIV